MKKTIFALSALAATLMITLSSCEAPKKKPKCLASQKAVKINADQTA